MKLKNKEFVRFLIGASVLGGVFTFIMYCDTIILRMLPLAKFDVSSTFYIATGVFNNLEVYCLC